MNDWKMAQQSRELRDAMDDAYDIIVGFGIENDLAYHLVDVFADESDGTARGIALTVADFRIDDAMEKLSDAIRIRREIAKTGGDE